MGRGGRPPSEFNEGSVRQRPRYPESSVRTPPRTPANIDLRIIRKSDPAMTDGVDMWHEFVDDFADKNHNLGRVLALGGVSITYVPDSSMTPMIMEKNPRDFHNAKGKLNLYRKVASGIRSFIRDQSGIAYIEKTESVAMTREARSALLKDIEIDYIFGLRQGSDDVTPGELSYRERQSLDEHAYGKSTLKVKGLELYGRRYGIDLGTNDQLYEEYQGINRYLQSEGFDTRRFLEKNWKPHGTLLIPFDHIDSPEPIAEYSPPEELAFKGIEVESYNL